jgi:RNA polymerase sigma-70 factor (ECF subfamily)
VARPDQVEAWAGKHGKEIHAYLWRMLGNAQDADDALQETFLRVLRHRRAVPILEPRAWLYAIAGNVARSQLRRRRTEGERRAMSEIDVAAPDGVHEMDRVDAVRRVVESLPSKQRQALVLRRYQGLSYDEVARVLGGSAQAARANVYQAVLKLKKAFPEEAR